MDQRETGKFICELRKQKNLTQKQLAEKLGISDRTVSKWETGNGMPEVSLMLPLCEELGVSVNELLSGKRLSAENYSEKAEENIMNLLKNGEKNQKNWVNLILAAAGWLLIGLYTYLFYGRTILNSNGHPTPSVYPETIILEFGATLLFLAGTGLTGSFGRAFPYAFSGRKHDPYELYRSLSAVSLAEKTFLLSGVLMFLTTAIILLLNLDQPEYGELIRDTFGGLDYFLPGIIAYLLLLPVKTRLKIKIFEAEKCGQKPVS